MADATYRVELVSGVPVLATAADGPLVRALDLTGAGRFIPIFSSVAAALAAEACQRDLAR